MTAVAVSGYVCAAAAGCSGTLAIFFCGITMSHYTWHSISASARVMSGNPPPCFPPFDAYFPPVFVGFSLCYPMTFRLPLTVRILVTYHIPGTLCIARSAQIQTPPCLAVHNFRVLCSVAEMFLFIYAGLDVSSKLSAHIVRAHDRGDVEFIRTVLTLAIALGLLILVVRALFVALAVAIVNLWRSYKCASPPLPPLYGCT